MTAAALLLASAVFTRPMGRVVTMDPIRAQTVYDAQAVQLVYETPLEIDYAARPYRLVPGLCELPETSSDGLVLTFRMRGLSPLSAPDVVRALERLGDPANVSPGGWTMKNVESVEATDARTFTVRLKSRSHVFPWMMAMAYAAVRAPDGSGTGPYRLEKWRRNHEMVFARNPDWHGWRDCAGEPFEKIRYLVIGDATTSWLMFLKGELDFLGEVPRDNWDVVIGRDGALVPSLAASGVTLHRTPTLEVHYVGFNMRDGVIGANRKLRQALNCAFDYPTWKRFHNGRVREADGPVPPGVDGHLDAPFAFAHDLAKARRLLAEAGYPEGRDMKTGRRLELTLDVSNSSSESRETGELVASFLERVGIRLELRPHTWEAFLRAVSEGRTQMFMMKWVGDYPDAENFLQLFLSRNASPGCNRSNYANAEFDREFDAAMASADAEERNAHWRRCQEILREDCPWIFCGFPEASSLMGPSVGGYVPGDFPYGQERHFRRLRH